ncbi:phosphopentomutase [Atheta coriaria]|uniref:phosphopentomutase n=1 Tax=Dalotia coriaria TaxID=877792 RepID=UPI0031F34510
MDYFSEELRQKLDEWLAWDQNKKNRAEVQDLVDRQDAEAAQKIMLPRISFGTAGLRGRMAAGYACMNDLVIIQTAQGILRHLENEHNEILKSNGIVLGYDGRYNSKRFAELTAAIFLNANYPVKLFSNLVPTPFVPFAVNKWKCAGGVMVTASHNPKEDNGYKVYGCNGSQIVSPSDKNIQKCILDNLEPWPTSWNTDILEGNTLLSDPLAETMEDYMSIVKGSILNEHFTQNDNTNLKFTYTAMHGVGYTYITEVMKQIGLEIVPVKEQIEPDPEFPTVKFPNPEEGKSSLDLSFKTADQNGCKVILANDPDADRLAVAEVNSSGKWTVFTGNEIGALLGWWLLQCYKMKNPNSDLKNVYMLASTVSSKILRSMARVEGFNFIETLTGFKWMGNKAYELLGEGKEVVFAFEEAIGFMCGSSVLDKDGVSAAAHLSTLAVHLYAQELTLQDCLDTIYKKYGNHVSNNSYYICHDGPTISKIFERLRNFNGSRSYPNNILDGKYEIMSVRDLTTGFDNTQPDMRAILPVSKSSQMITFEFNNGLVITIRTSGTEPKIKYYSELCSMAGESDKEESIELLNEMVTAIVEEFLQPEVNGLIPKAD